VGPEKKVVGPEKKVVGPKQKVVGPEKKSWVPSKMFPHIYLFPFGMRVFRFLRLSQMYVERIKDLKAVDIDRSVYKYKPSVDGTVELHAPYSTQLFGRYIYY
jgi:hypothetical protein